MQPCTFKLSSGWDTVQPSHFAKWIANYGPRSPAALLRAPVRALSSLHLAPRNLGCKLDPSNPEVVARSGASSVLRSHGLTPLHAEIAARGERHMLMRMVHEAAGVLPNSRCTPDSQTPTSLHAPRTDLASQAHRSRLPAGSQCLPDGQQGRSRHLQSAMVGQRGTGKLRWVVVMDEVWV